MNKKFILARKCTTDKAMKILYKFILSFLSVGILILLSVSFIFYFQFKSALSDRTFEQLSSVNMLKKTAVEEAIVEKVNMLDEARKKGDRRVVDKMAANLQLTELTEYDSLERTFSVKVLDLSAKYNELTLAFVVPFKKQTLIFIEKPAYIQKVLSERTGLGATGESYIVGADFKMRSRSRFFANKNPEDIQVHSEAVKNAMTGNEGKSLLKDYRGILVLSAYRKIQVKGLQWVILSEIDEAEAMAPVKKMKTKIFIIVMVVFVFLVFVSIVIARKISRPVEENEMLSLQSKAALIKGQEEERIRLSKDIHDGAGPLLTSIKLQLSALKIEEAEKEKLKQVIDETIHEMRRISHNLMPPVLLDFGVGPAIKNLVEDLSKSLPCEIVFIDDLRKSSTKLNKEINVALYRIAQEALNNAVKHAQAKNIKISLTEFPDKVCLYVSDDGIGFPVSIKDITGKGLHNMRERVLLLNGEIFINSDGSGTVIEVEMPLI